jgi:Zn-dependent metalloprotease
VKNGKLSKLSGEIVVDFDESNDYSPVPALSSAQAIDIAVKKVNAQLYMWQDAGMEQRIKDQTGNTQASYAPTATLVWFNDGDEISPRDLRLAFKIDVYAKQPLSRADYFIDAKNGNYLGKKDKIFYTDATGTAATAYSGSQTIHSDFTGTSYRLRDYTKGSGIITLHGESAQRGTDYTSTSANWTLTGTNIAALDAHYGVSQTYAFYLANFNRNSYNGTGGALYSYVNDPTYTDNAFWDGSAMNFNKRSTGAPGGVTGIDVTGHELTHGVTQTTSGLNYNGEPGAMNESMSDIMGKSVQFWSKPSDVNWLMSNDMNWIIRSMSNPNSQGQPDTYKGTNWYTGTADNGGVHTNSGVGNFMFYLLVTGGSGTNDIGNGFSVTGIGLAKADQILYRSETVYLSPTSKYADWRTACVNAATDLYGSGSNEVTQVQNAWYAVGVGTAGGVGGSCGTPTGLASSSITNTSATVSWAAVSGAVTYNLQWKASLSSTWTTVSGLGTTSRSLTGLTAGTAYQFQVQTVCSAGTSAYSAASSFTTTGGGAITYCASKGNSTTYEWIKQIIFGTINNTSNSNSGYGNFTNLSTNVTAGSSYTITFKPGYSGSTYREYWTVYIDYNQNGTLNNTGETVVQVSTTSVNGGTANITIPTTAKSGPTRMRIQMHYGGQITNPCTAFNYGEVEDYTVNISGGSGFTSSGLNSLQDVTNKLPAIIVAPNPVRGLNATTNYRLADNGNTVMKVIDLDGRILKTIELGNQTAGEHVYSLGLNKISSGNYILILEQNAKIVARNPFVITR